MNDATSTDQINLSLNEQVIDYNKSSDVKLETFHINVNKYNVLSKINLLKERMKFYQELKNMDTAP